MSGTSTKPKIKQKAKGKPKLTVEQRKANKLKADHIRSARSIFRNVGFDRLGDVAGKEVKFLNQKGEFDDCFLYENVLLLVEYTTSSSSNVSDHLKHKKIIFDKVIENQRLFFEYLMTLSSELSAAVVDGYHIDRYKIVVVYCSRYDFDAEIKSVVDSPRYLDFPVLKYFEKISTSIKLSALAEFVAFLGINSTEVGEGGVIKKPGALVPYPGSILPEEASGFPPGYKVVSFYADAEALLQRAFVLRRKGWRGSNEAYQRMIIPKKIEDICNSLRVKGQVAVNNIIATLPSDVHPIGSDGHTVDISSLNETKAVTITLPLRQNTVGLIDGQHRLFLIIRPERTIRRLPNYVISKTC